MKSSPTNSINSMSNIPDPCTGCRLPATAGYRIPQLYPVVGQHLSNPVAHVVWLTTTKLLPLVTGINVLTGNGTTFEMRFGFCNKMMKVLIWPEVATYFTMVESFLRRKVHISDYCYYEL